MLNVCDSHEDICACLQKNVHEGYALLSWYMSTDVLSAAGAYRPIVQFSVHADNKVGRLNKLCLSLYTRYILWRYLFWTQPIVPLSA